MKTTEPGRARAALEFGPDVLLGRSVKQNLGRQSAEPRHITLGKVPKRYAEALKVKVEDLASAALHGHYD